MNGLSGLGRGLPCGCKFSGIFVCLFVFIPLSPRSETSQSSSPSLLCLSLLVILPPGVSFLCPSPVRSLRSRGPSIHCGAPSLPLTFEVEAQGHQIQERFSGLKLALGFAYLLGYTFSFCFAPLHIEFLYLFFLNQFACI